MNNESLMRRIASATDAQRPLTAAQTTPQAAPAAREAVAPPPVQRAAPVQPQSVQQQVTPRQPVLQPAGSVQQGQRPVAPQQQAQRQPVPQQAVPQQPATQQPQATPVAPAPQAPVQAAPSTFREGEFSFAAPPEPEVSERRERDKPRDSVTLGTLSTCDGVNATICSPIEENSEEIAVGEMIIIPVGANRVIGLVFQIDKTFGQHGEEQLAIQVELQGEIRRTDDGKSKFSKGIASYPSIGSNVFKIDGVDLGRLYAATGTRNVIVGNLSQSEEIPAFIDAENMLSKHFAVMGSTGCGKSSAVSLLLRAAQEVVPDLRTLVLDPHNEYSNAFPEANTIDSERMELPFWLFQLEEYAAVLFRGKPVIGDEIEALREFIPEAKQRFRDGEERASLRTDSASSAFTADTPVPYRISDVLALIEAEMGQLEARFSRPVLKSLKSRIVAHCGDARYRFMFRDKTISDKAQDILNLFFNLSSSGSNMTIFQMAGLPSEVVNSVASVLCRLAFELCIAAHGKLKILMVCEEAHRYIPADLNGGFEPTRRAIGRIAKEGRKYGSFMAIISQRPAELDPTIMSQCSTVFSLRLSNEQDQDFIKQAISSSSKSTISFLSSLSNREAIAFGEALSAPMRLKFRNLPQHWLPGGDIDVFHPNNQDVTGASVSHVFGKWRGVTGASTVGQANVA